MNESQKDVAKACLEAAEQNTMTFPQIVGSLVEAGFESYVIDFRRATATYYLPDGDCIQLSAHLVDAPIALAFDTEGMQAAIREAQQQVPGFTYRGFCEKAVSAGCAGYLVSFVGARVLYVGRTAETHVEHFPNQ